MRKELGLIVEDDKRNVEAAKFCFENYIKCVKIDFTKCFSDGMKLLMKKRKKYNFAIFDLTLPYFIGENAIEIGHELADKATLYLIPWAIITSGIDHHKCESAFVSYFWNDGKFHEITETPKNNPKAWQIIYKTLKNPYRNGCSFNKSLEYTLKRTSPENPAAVLMKLMGKLAKKLL